MNQSFSFKGITFVLLIFALVLSEGAGAQNVVYSRTRTMEKPHGEDVFIRFFGNSGDMLVHNYDYSLKANVFTCRKAPTHPASNKIVIPLESNQYGEVKYKVLDMVVVGNMCFYCGRKTCITGIEESPEGQPYLVFESKGFVGQISLDHITAEQGGKAARRMTEISTTKEIARIDAWISPTSTTDTLLAMVGITLDDKSCLVIAKDSNTGFKYMRYTSSDDTEEFTDIAFTEGQLLVASRFMNENYLLGFREALARHVYKDTVIGLYTLFHQNLAYHIGSCYSMPIYQHDELPVDKADISTVDLVDENWIDAIPTLWNTLYALPTSIEQRCLSGNYIIINSEDETETE